MYTVNILLQQLINALTYGSLIGFIAIGYTMVYGTLKLINFAHGNLVIFSVFLIITLIDQLHITIVISFILSLFCVGFIAVGVYYAAYRPLRYSNKVNLVVSALGAGMIIQNLIILLWGTSPKLFPIPLYLSENIYIKSLILNKLGILILIINIVVMSLFYYVHNKTRFGLAIKVVSTDYETASLMGINISKIIVLIFIVGACLGALGGLFIGMSYKSVDFTMGFQYGLQAFIASIIGGVGNIAGAMIGGLIIGLIHTLSVGYLSDIYADVFTYIIIILFLIIRPNGLFGKFIEEKV